MASFAKVLLIQLLSWIIAVATTCLCGVTVGPLQWGPYIVLLVVTFAYNFWRFYVGRVWKNLRRWMIYCLSANLLRQKLPLWLYDGLNYCGLVHGFSFATAYCMNMWYDVDLWVFTIVTASVYLWLTRLGNKKKLEAANTFQEWTFWQMLSSGVKVGGIVAGLADLGLKVLPKDFMAASIVADLLKCIAEFLRASTKLSGDSKVPLEEPVELEPVPLEADDKYSPGWFDWLRRRNDAVAKNEAKLAAMKMRAALNQLPIENDDDDEISQVLTWTETFRNLRDKIREILIKHRARFAWFFAAVLSGVVIYCIRHHRSALESALEATQRGQKGANSGKQYKSRGKKAHMKNGATRAVTGKKDFWAYYDAGDVDAIVDVYVNGEPVSKSKIRAGEKLAPGDYVIIRMYGNHVIEDEFTVTGVKSTRIGATGGDNDDLKAMAARRNGGKAPMTISGKRAKELGFESMTVIEPATISMEYAVHDVNCKHIENPDMFDDCLDDCCWVAQISYVMNGDKVKVTNTGAQVVVVDKKQKPNKPLPPVPKKKTEAKQEPTEPVQNEVRKEVPVTGNQAKPPVSGAMPADDYKKLNKADKKASSDYKKVVEAANSKLEALVASSPKVNIRHAEFRIDVLKDDEYISSGVVAWCGIIVNTHAYEQATHFSFADKKIPKTKIWYSNPRNKDITVCAFFDGCPRPVQKKHFERPAEGTAVYMIDQDAQVCRGMVISVDEESMFGLQARATYSSEPGDCGCAVLNSNGSIVGIHFSAGKAKQDNCFYPVNDALLALSPKAACPSPRDA